MNDKVDKKQFEQDFKKRKLRGIKMFAKKADDILYEVHLGETIVKQNQFDILLAKMEEMNSSLNNKIDEVNTNLNNKIDEVNTKMDEGFKKVNSRLDNVETRLTNVETRLTNVETRLTNVETILIKHDDAMVEHGWFKKSNMNK